MELKAGKMIFLKVVEGSRLRNIYIEYLEMCKLVKLVSKENRLSLLLCLESLCSYTVSCFISFLRRQFLFQVKFPYKALLREEKKHNSSTVVCYCCLKMATKNKAYMFPV